MGFSDEQLKNARTCTTCAQEKPLSDFYPVGRNTGRVRASCKACYADYVRGNQARRNETARARSKRQQDVPVGYVKTCIKCGETKPQSGFYRDGANRDGLATYCIQCKIADRAKYYEANRERINEGRREQAKKLGPEFRRNADLLARYGVTSEWVESALVAQGGCAICGSDQHNGRGWHVDHDHACCPTPGRSCGRCVRGVLCSNCNLMLGHAKDDPARLASAIGYLEASSVVVS